MSTWLNWRPPQTHQSALTSYIAISFTSFPCQWGAVASLCPTGFCPWATWMLNMCSIVQPSPAKFKGSAEGNQIPAYRATRAPEGTVPSATNTPLPLDGLSMPEGRTFTSLTPAQSWASRCAHPRSLARGRRTLDPCLVRVAEKPCKLKPSGAEQKPRSTESTESKGKARPGRHSLGQSCCL